MSNMGVSEAYLQIPIDEDGAPVFRYTVGTNVVADLRIRFGWRSSGGYSGLQGSALQHSYDE